MKSLTSITIKDTSKAIEAIEVINNTPLYIALIIDKNNKLVGTITDGDIRRGLIKGETPESNVKKFMNKNFISIYEEDLSDSNLRNIFNKGIDIVPLLDSYGRIKKLLQKNDILLRSKSKVNDVVIMAGGKGTRLRPYTEDCPKPMVEINGKPMLEIILEKCINSGFSNFYFSVNYLKDQIIDYFGDGKKWGIKISYIFEKFPLGTAGPLRLLPQDSKSPVLVLNADIITNLNLELFIEFHEKNNSEMTIASKNETYTIPYGVIYTSDIELKKIIEKPTYNFLVSAGIYVVNKNIIDLIPKDSFCDMPELISFAKDKNLKVTTFPIHEFWLDVGRPETLKKANEEWTKN